MKYVRKNFIPAWRKTIWQWQAKEGSTSMFTQRYDLWNVAFPIESCRAWSSRRVRTLLVVRRGYFFSPQLLFGKDLRSPRQASCIHEKPSKRTNSEYKQSIFWGSTNHHNKTRVQFSRKVADLSKSRQWYHSSRMPISSRKYVLFTGNPQMSRWCTHLVFSLIFVVKLEKATSPKL